MKLFPEHPAELELEDDIDERLCGLEPEPLDVLHQEHLDQLDRISELAPATTSLPAAARTQPPAARTADDVTFSRSRAAGLHNPGA
jgi:hypothetical protein